MQLPGSWVDSLFARLQVRYGAAWNRMWEGIDIAAVKADWAEELGGFSERPDAIAYALENLPPEFPPTVAQFLAICQRRPDSLPKALPAPKATPESVAVAKKVAEAIAPRPGLGWAHALRRREQKCERLTAAQRAMWREALKQETGDDAA